MPTIAARPLKPSFRFTLAPAREAFGRRGSASFPPSRAADRSDRRCGNRTPGYGRRNGMGRWIVGIVVAVALLFAACGGDDADHAQAKAPRPSVPPPSGAQRVVPTRDAV